MWLEPQTLRLASPYLSSFRAVTSLSLHSLPVYRFDEEDVNAIFGHFFPTVKKLSLDDPKSSPHGLIRFLSHFSAMENLSVSDPAWVEQGAVISIVGYTPPFTGKLYLSGFQQNSTPFIRLLSKSPINFRHIIIMNCDWDPLPFSRLLRCMSHSLRFLAVSAWFKGMLFTAQMHPHLTSYLSKNTSSRPSTSPPVTNSKKSGSSLACSLQPICH